MHVRLIAFITVVALIVSGSTLFARTARGEDQPNVITDSQIAMIKTHCTDLQASLNRLHQSDTLLRFNRGELYRTISDKLMVPLNQRIASNQLDGSTLVQITANYNTSYQTFFDSYKVYEVSLSAALSTDCVRQPTTFYDQVADARAKRIALHTASVRLVELAGQYKKSFGDFRKKADVTTEATR